MKQDFQFPAMKHFQFPAIINNILFICTYLLLQSDFNRPRSSSVSASSPLPAAITPHFDCIRLKSTSRRTYCRSAFGYDAKGVC